jgi:hypothetical protein
MFTMELCLESGVFVSNPRRLMKRLGRKGLALWRAHQMLKGWGADVQNLRHIHAAIFANRKDAMKFGHKPPSSGLMSAEEIKAINEAHRDAGAFDERKPGEIVAVI